MSSYADITEIRAAIGLNSESEDQILSDLLDAVEDNINRFCQRPDGFIADSSASARYYVGKGLPWIMIDEFVEVTAVSVKDASSDTTYTSWTVPTTNMAGDGDYFAFAGHPHYPDLNPTSRNKPYTGLMVDPNGSYSDFTDGTYITRGGFRPISEVPHTVPTVQVTAKWGYATSIPSSIHTAAIMQVTRWYKRMEGSMADSLANPEFGRVTYLQSLDPDIRQILINGRFVARQVG